MSFRLSHPNDSNLSAVYGSLPEASYDTGQVVDRRVSAREGCHAPAMGAIEVWMPTGPRALYGLLGARFEPDARGLSIRVPVVPGIEGPRFAQTIAASYDEVRVGLPDEYGREVVHWLAYEAEKLGFGPGVLTIERAAHSLVGSSRSVFAALAVLVVRLIAERLDDRESATIGEIIRDTMMRSASNRLGEPGRTA
jgi:hypothetical protein